MESFEDWMEGKTWEAIKRGVQAGIKTYKKTLQSENNPKIELMNDLLQANTKEQMQAVAAKMAEKGLVFTRAGIGSEKSQTIRKWLIEDVQSQARNHPEENGSQRHDFSPWVEKRELVGNPYFPRHQLRRSN
jgi:hypothetical protein